jgi:hypothetical protein
MEQVTAQKVANFQKIVRDIVDGKINGSEAVSSKL